MPATDEPLFSAEEITELPRRLDEAMQAHLAWSQRLLRCALLGEPPAEDMLQTNAHELCKFGRWFGPVSERLGKLDQPGRGGGRPALPGSDRLGDRGGGL